MLQQLPSEAGIAFEVFQALDQQDLEELTVYELALLAQSKLQLRQVVQAAANAEERFERHLQAEREGRLPVVWVAPVSVHRTGPEERPDGPEPPAPTPKQD